MEAKKKEPTSPQDEFQQKKQQMKTLSMIEKLIYSKRGDVDLSVLQQF